MLKTDKEQEILELQAKKELLTPGLKEAFENKTNAYRAYMELNFKWMRLRDEFEAFDREEKLIFFSIPKNKTKPTKKMPKDYAKEAQENAKKTAMKALESLPVELREQILKQFK